MRLKNRKKSAAAIKSMKVGTDELKDLIKGAVKEAMGEEDDTGDDGSDTAAALDGITAEDMADIIEQAVDNANEKRKSRKDAGEEVGDLTADEVIQEAAEIIDSMTADEGICVAGNSAGKKAWEKHLPAKILRYWNTAVIAGAVPHCQRRTYHGHVHRGNYYGLRFQRNRRNRSSVP